MSGISSSSAAVVSCRMNVWHALETSRGLTAVAASWRERLGNQFEAFKEAFLQRAPGVAKGMPCPRGCGCTHEIVTRVEGRGLSEEGETSSIRAICRCDPATCPDILLTPEDVVLLELSWNKLARAVCRVFEFNYKATDLGLLNTRQIGSWSIDAVPVILTIQHERGWFRSVLLELLARLRQRFILLAPTAKNMDAVSQELLGSSGAGFFSLDGTVTLDAEGGLRLTRASAGELFAKFSPKARDADEDLATRAFALVHQLDAEGTRKAPSVLAVFRMYCIEGHSLSTIARKCRTTRMTIRHRLKQIEIRTGVNIEQLRKVSAHFEEAEASFNDSRASHIHRKNLIYDEDDANES
jgi:hypothetical protein